nr:glycosyltransferase family 2 protein [Chitinophaga sp. Cy-1792]
MATYNGEKYISEQIQSIINQDYPEWHILVRDDGSKDRTVEIVRGFIKKYPGKISLVEDNERGLGSSGNFYRLMQHAKAPYIMLSDQDDVWMNDKITVTMNKLAEMEQHFGNNIPLLVFTDLSVVNNSLTVINPSFWKAQALDPEICRKTYKTVAQSTITGCTVMINKKALEYIFPVPIQSMQHDHWMGIVIGYHGKTDYINRPTIYYRQHQHNDVGMKEINAGYLLSKWNRVYGMYKECYLLKYRAKLNFSLMAAVIFKLAFNTKRVFLKKK